MLKWERKSSPRIGLFTSAMMKAQLNRCRRPKSRVRDWEPYVEMGVLLTASRHRVSLCTRLEGEDGITLTAAPVSIVNLRVCR